MAILNIWETGGEMDSTRQLMEAKKVHIFI